MQSTTIHQRFIKLFTLTTLCFIAVSFAAPTGLDSYEIYLNKQLLLKQHVNQPLSLRKLQLDKAKDNDQLRIEYRHCQTPYVGTDRVILIKDQKGNTLKKWTFANAAGANSSMVIGVKELRLLESKKGLHDLSMHYSSRELSKGDTLAYIHLK